MKQRLRILLPLLGLFFITGCLEFERQTVSCRHDPVTDTLYIFQDYQGIFGADDPVVLSDNEREQMASVMKGERTFFFGNWITEYNREALQEIQQRPQGSLDENKTNEADIRALAKVALANVKVDNLGFYLNRKNQLCGAQRVTVSHASQVLAALNKVLWVLARREAGKDDLSDEEKRLLLQFADGGHKALRLDGRRLEMRWPVTEEDYLKFKDRTPQGKAFLESGAQMSYADGMILIALGAEGATSFSLTLPVSENSYSGNALVEARKYGVKESFDAARLAKEFLDPPGSTNLN